MHDTRGGKVAPVDGQQRKGEVLLWASLRKGSWTALLYLAPIVVDNWPVSTKRTIGDVLILEPERRGN